MIIDEDVYLEHFGIKGMKWGVRNARAGSRVSISKSGEITLKKGARLQRVVRRSNGLLLKVGKDLGSEVSYASFTKADNAGYEKYLGVNKNLLNKKASDVLTFTAKTDLKSPSPRDARRMFFETLKTNPKAREEVEKNLGFPFKKEHVADAISDPHSETAKALHDVAYTSGNFRKEPSIANIAFHKKLQKSGYNMLLDSRDSSTGIADKPVILIKPKNTVEITGKRAVDKMSKRSAKKVLKEQEKFSKGKSFLETLGENA